MPRPRHLRRRLIAPLAIVALALATSWEARADAPEPEEPATAPPPPTDNPEATGTSDVSSAAPEAPTPVDTAPPPPAPETPPAAVSQEAKTARQESVTDAKRRNEVQAFTHTCPSWAFELTATAYAFGNQSIEASQGGNPARGLETQLEYQPSFLQFLGVLGFGPSFGDFPITNPGTLSLATTSTGSAISIWELGGQLRYQARFFHEQIFVPMGGYEAQFLTYHFADGNTGGVVAKGPFAGAMLLLNQLEPSAASEIYVQSGITRSYLVAEVKDIAAEGSVVSFTGLSWYFGFRLEY